MIFQLTDRMTQDAFAKTGIDEKYFPEYEAEVNRRFKALQNDCPDDDETIYDDCNALASLNLTDDYIRFYVEEAEKGHCHKWCDSVAKEGVTYGNDECIYRIAYDNLESDEEKSRELDIHTNSLSNDPIFIERYKSMFEENIPNLTENTEEYTRIYHSLIHEGKSEVYAHAYAYVSGDFKPFFCEIYAEAYELATKHGMDSTEAYCFGDFCTEACDQGYEVYIRDFLKQYNEDWQKEFYLHLICDEIKREEKREIQSAELAEIKMELGLIL